MTIISKFIASYFSNTAVLLEERCVEDEYEMVAYYQIVQHSKNLPSVIELKDIPPRDTVEITLFDSTSIEASMYAVYSSNEANSSWSQFEQRYSEMDKEDPFVIKIRIAKKCICNILSIYSLKYYLKHLEQTDIISLLSIFDKYFKSGNLVLESQTSDESMLLITDRIAFVQNNVTPTFSTSDNNDVSAKIIAKAKTLCCNDMIKTHLLPSNFLVRKSQGDYCCQFAKLLNKVALIYCLCFISDYVSLNDNKLSLKSTDIRLYQEH